MKALNLGLVMMRFFNFVQSKLFKEYIDKQWFSRVITKNLQYFGTSIVIWVCFATGLMQLVGGFDGDYGEFMRSFVATSLIGLGRIDFHNIPG
jgi:hypothetical protein